MKPRIWALCAPLVLALGGTALAAEPMPPDQVVQQTGEQVMQQIDPNKDALRKDPARLYQIVNDIILPHFDFDYMSQLVLGKNWKGANDAQRQRFADAFKIMLVRTYSNALLEYSGTPVKYLPLKMAPGAKDVSYRAEITLPSGQTVPMNYSLRLTDRWKVYDITIDAISLVTNYRGVFAGEVKKNGLDSLIARLETKNAGSAAAKAKATP